MYSSYSNLLTGSNLQRELRIPHEGSNTNNKPRVHTISPNTRQTAKTAGYSAGGRFILGKGMLRLTTNGHQDVKNTYMVKQDGDM